MAIEGISVVGSSRSGKAMAAHAIPNELGYLRLELDSGVRRLSYTNRRSPSASATSPRTESAVWNDSVGGLTAPATPVANMRTYSTSIEIMSSISRRPHPKEHTRDRTPDLAVPSLKHVIASHEVNKPFGRGGRNAAEKFRYIP